MSVVAHILDGFYATRAVTSPANLRFVVASLKHLVPGKAGSNRKQPLVYRPGNIPDCMMSDSEPSV